MIARTVRVKARRGFAAMSPEKWREISIKGGASVPADRRAFAQNPELAGSAGREGGHAKRRNFGDRAPQDQHPLYCSWSGMLSRCRTPTDTAYARYGGRGIFVCERWLKFENFVLDMGERPPGMSIDRIDNDGGYSPDNCRWATRGEQANNRRNTKSLTVRGETLTLSAWSANTGINRATLYQRLCAGWSPEDIVSTPLLGRHDRRSAR